MMLPEEEEIEARVNSCIRGALDTISSSPRYQCHLLILLLILFQTMSFSAWESPSSTLILSSSVKARRT